MLGLRSPTARATRRRGLRSAARASYFAVSVPSNVTVAPVASGSSVREALIRARFGRMSVSFCARAVDGITRLLPAPDLFLYMYIRKEAVRSSQIEGTQPTVAGAVNQLVQLGIMKEVTGKQRDRVFAYDKYLAILSEDVETPAPVSGA